MEVSEIQLFLADEGRLKAYVTVTFEKCFVVRDLKVIDGNKGLFVAMPSKKKKDGTYKDIAHPINSEFRSHLERMIIERYNEESKMSKDTDYRPKSYDDEAGYFESEEGKAEIANASLVSLQNFREAEAGIGPVIKR